MKTIIFVILALLSFSCEKVDVSPATVDCGQGITNTQVWISGTWNVSGLGTVVFSNNYTVSNCGQTVKLSNGDKIEDISYLHRDYMSVKINGVLGTMQRQ